MHSKQNGCSFVWFSPWSLNVSLILQSLRICFILPFLAGRCLARTHFQVIMRIFGLFAEVFQVCKGRPFLKQSWNNDERWCFLGRFLQWLLYVSQILFLIRISKGLLRLEFILCGYYHWTLFLDAKVQEALWLFKSISILGSITLAVGWTNQQNLRWWRLWTLAFQHIVISIIDDFHTVVWWIFKSIGILLLVIQILRKK